MLYQVSELRSARYDPLAYLSPRFTDKEDDVIDVPKGMSGGGVEEQEKAPKSGVLPLVCAGL